MMWAGNHWILSDEKGKLTWMANGITEELMELDMESKPESLWWTSTYKAEDGLTLTVPKQKHTWGDAVRR